MNRNHKPHHETGMDGSVLRDQQGEAVLLVGREPGRVHKGEDPDPDFEGRVGCRKEKGTWSEERQRRRGDTGI